MRRTRKPRWPVLLLMAWTFGAAAETFGTGEVAVITAKGRYVIAVELATSSAQRNQGLQGRQHLRAGTGMLFDFQRPQPVAMWMKNTLIPLDMLFIAADGRIVNVVRRTVPLSLKTIPSTGPVRWVLELNAGASARMGIQPGDRVIRMR